MSGVYCPKCSVDVGFETIKESVLSNRFRCANCDVKLSYRTIRKARFIFFFGAFLLLFLLVYLKILTEQVFMNLMFFLGSDFDVSPIVVIIFFASCWFSWKWYERMIAKYLRANCELVLRKDSGCDEDD